MSDVPVSNETGVKHTQEVSFQQIAAIFTQRAFTAEERVGVQNLVVTLKAKKKKNKDEHFWLKKLEYFLKSNTEEKQGNSVSSSPSSDAPTLTENVPLSPIDAFNDVNTSGSSDTTTTSLSTLKHRIDEDTLNPLEQAEALKRVLDELRISQRELSEGIGRSTRFVSDMLSLLKLPDHIKQQVARGELAPTGKVVRGYLQTKRLNGDTRAIASTVDAGLALAPQIPVNRDAAIALCRLLIWISEHEEGLETIKPTIDDESTRHEIKHLLENNAFRVVEALL